MTVATADLSEIIQLIPGYDPVATAGDCRFDDEAAQLALDFFPEMLKHVQGKWAGQPVYLEASQQAPIANVYGWKRPDGTRRYRTVFEMVGRKNGKTTKLAGIGLYGLFAEGEAGAGIYSAAADREQAKLVWSVAAGMIRQNPELAAACRIYIGYKSFELKDNSGAWRVLSSDAGTKHGLNVFYALVDELHAHKSRELLDVLMTGTGSRAQPLVWIITTSDWDRESICNETLDYAIKVRDGIIDDPSFLPVLHMAGRDDDWTKPTTWAKANPLLDISVSREYLEQECKRAQEIPAFENTFKRLHCNIRTEQATRWIPMSLWDACSDPIDPKSLEGLPCWGGLDLSSTQDTTSLVLIFPDADNAVLPFFWIPGDNAERREKLDRVPYLVWAREGLIELTPGNVVDYRFIRAKVNTIAKLYKLQSIGYDPYNATQLSLQLGDEDGIDMVEMRQGSPTLNEPMKYLETLWLGRDFRHGGHKVLRWQASNIAVKLDEKENYKPDKKSSRERIDGIVALIMAVGRAMVTTDGGASVYDERGILTL